VIRALEREDAHEPFMTVVEERLDAVDHPALAGATATVEAEYESLVGAMVALADEDDDYVQLSAKRLAHYVFDVYTAALLLAEAQADLDGYGPTGEADGRTALVARRFVQNYLEDRDARGIGSGDRFPLEHADAVVRYATVEPDALVETAEAD